ncbi:MAG: shikimate dehydrogenase [Xanthomonadales bacterium]|nr:shikimate dehydrogenase [Xanthomonadales bacterium]
MSESSARPSAQHDHGQPLKLAVFGDPVAHSLSPQIHASFAQQLGLNVDYRAIHVRAEELTSALERFAAEGGMGLNLTVPHKTAGLEHCAQLSPRARLACAVNTLKRVAGRWHGDNTDGAGLVWDLQQHCGVDFRQRPVVLVGAGGAAAGALAAILPLAKRVLLVNRNPAKAEDLLQNAQALFPQYQHHIDVQALAELNLPANAVVINATSCGHQGICPDLPPARPDLLAYDLNYGPAADPFLNWARQSQAQAVDGLGMLVGQAAEAFTVWTQQRPDAEAVLRQLRD